MGIITGRFERKPCYNSYPPSYPLFLRIPLPPTSLVIKKYSAAEYLRPQLTHNLLAYLSASVVAVTEQF